MKKKWKLAFSPRKLRFHLLLFFTLFASVSLNAQTVTGTVTDGDNKPVVGATVAVKTTGRATVTNNSGTFSINASGTDILVISYVGFLQREISVGDKTSMAVRLIRNEKIQDEVIVTALGMRRQSRKLGYSATNVNPDEMVKNRTINMAESLEGRVAGLNITPPAAGAGSSNQIRLRGQVGFAGADNSPLIVLNGLPLDQGARNAEGAGQQRDRGDNLANINPDDIETMTVLKGSTAAALYGSRAARGAIIITTKSGQKNQGIGVDFTSSYTTSEALNFMDEIVQTEYGQGQSGIKFTTAGQIEANGQFGWGAKLDGLPTVNFDGVMRPYSAHPYQLFDYLQNGTNFTNTLGLSGGGSNGSFRTSFSSTDAKGIVPGNKYKRTIFNLGLNHNITKNLKLQLNVNYADEDYINPPQIGTQGDGVVNFFNRMPISTPIEAYNEHAINSVGAEWKTSGFLGTVNNPYYPLQKGQKYKEDRNRLLGTATLRYDITSWLYAQGRFNYDRGTNMAEWYALNGTGAAVLTNNDGTYRGNYNLDNTTTTDINAEFLVGGGKEFKKFSIDASFGGNTLRGEWKNMNQTSSNFTVQDLYSVPNGTVKTQAYNYNKSRINSLYGLAEFGWNRMIYLNFTGRNDWFSVLNPEYNNKFYPSVSGSFVFSELLKIKIGLPMVSSELRGQRLEVSLVWDPMKEC
jgi:TonB-linked SusC/RagA family outer membrane protein